MLRSLVEKNPKHINGLLHLARILSEKYQNESEFVPTETAVTSNGEIYVADGYGAQYISHYDKDGKLKNVFGGRGLAEKHLPTP